MGAANGWPVAGLAAAVITIALHLVLSSNPLAQTKFIVFVTCVGLLVESTLTYAGFTRFVTFLVSTAYSLPPPLPPVWLLAMWAAFATIVTVSLTWLQTKPILAFLLGAVGGPLAYIAGERLGAMTLLEPRIMSIAALAFAWGIVTVLLVKAGAKIQQHDTRQ